MTPAGSVNAWTCGTCGRSMIAVCVDAGVTPMFLGCRSTEGCRGRAVSAGFPPELQAVAEHRIGWEWFKPSLKRAKRQGPEMYEHVRLGGLELRRRAA